eukprot:356488-Chlamydomonas_euryale.AAC.11
MLEQTHRHARADAQTCPHRQGLQTQAGMLEGQSTPGMHAHASNACMHGRAEWPACMLLLLPPTCMAGMWTGVHACVHACVSNKHVRCSDRHPHACMHAWGATWQGHLHGALGGMQAGRATWQGHLHGAVGGVHAWGAT